MVLEFTEAEARNLADFVEFNLIEVIRADTDIDNIEWVCSMVTAYQKLVEAVKNG